MVLRAIGMGYGGACCVQWNGMEWGMVLRAMGNVGNGAACKKFSSNRRGRVDGSPTQTRAPLGLTVARELMGV